MEQRPLRLGDILDDYCPRERRVTNHAVVAMIEDAIKQTRCTTCDAEHPYKGGKAPKRRKPSSTGALYQEVLAGITDAGTVVHPSPDAPATTDPQSSDAGLPEAEVDDAVPVAAAPVPAPEPELPAETDREDVASVPPIDEGPVHRPLIRATLARPEGIKDARPVPEFTIRQNAGRGNGHFRGDNRGGRGRGPVSQGSGSGQPRFGRGGQGRGPSRGQSPFGRGQGQGQGQGQPRHGGKKRSR